MIRKGTELTEEQYWRILELLPKQRGNAKTKNLMALSVLVYICMNGCSWRALPEKFGKWHAVYVRFSRRAKSGGCVRFHSRSPGSYELSTDRGVFFPVSADDGKLLDVFDWKVKKKGQRWRFCHLSRPNGNIHYIL